MSHGWSFSTCMCMWRGAPKSSLSWLKWDVHTRRWGGKNSLWINAGEADFKTIYFSSCPIPHVVLESVSPEPYHLLPHMLSSSSNRKINVSSSSVWSSSDFRSSEIIVIFFCCEKYIFFTFNFSLLFPLTTHNCQYNSLIFHNARCRW